MSGTPLQLVILSELSELRQALICPSRAHQLSILTGSGIQNKQNSLHAAAMIILFKSFLGILLLDPSFFFHHIVPQVYPSI